MRSASNLSTRPKGHRMQYKTLGNTGLLVSRICLGAMTFSSASEGIWQHIAGTDQQEVDHLIKTSIDAGVNFIDTADVYSNGQSEIMLGQSLKNLNIARKDIIIASKAFGRTGQGRNDVGASRGHILDAIDASLKRLNTDYIDLYQVHGTDLLTPLDETLRALDTLVQQGKIRYIGVSNWHAWRLMKAAGIADARNFAPIDTLQAYYSIAGRDLEREIVPLLEDQKIGLLAWSPLAGGLLSGKYTRENQKPAESRRSTFDFPIVDKERTWKILDVMIPIAKAHNASPATIALAWMLAKPFVTSIIIGAKRPQQLTENLAAVDLTLTEGELKQLDEVSALPPEYPGWMVPFQNSNRIDPTIPRPGIENK
jgi:aryl-alcohol dehydrogenase-like predicted oxidoreductase